MSSSSSSSGGGVVGGKGVRACAACGKTGAKARCGRCKAAWFCDKACQSAAWPAHRATCGNGSASGARGATHKVTVRPAAPGTDAAADAVAHSLRGAIAKGTELFPDAEGAVSGSGAHGEAASSEEAAALEARRMLRRMRDTVRGGRAALGGEAMEGLFLTLLDPVAFRKHVYRGVEVEEGSDAPRSLQDLLGRREYQGELEGAMLAAVKRGQGVLESVRSKAAAAGEVMDKATYAHLWPQVLREAFAREVVGMVTAISKRRQADAARDASTMASPLVPAARWDQLDSEALAGLLGPPLSTVPPPSHPASVGTGSGSSPAVRVARGSGYAVVDGFMGAAWVPALLRDCERMRRMGRFAGEGGKAGGGASGGDGGGGASSGGGAAATAGAGAAGGKAPSSPASPSPSHAAPRAPAIAWVEPLEVASQYPALQEALERLHALPYELNAKADLRAQVPFRGATMAAYYAPGAGHPRRLDNGSGGSDGGDRGVKVTCVYFVGAAVADAGGAGGSGGGGSSGSGGGDDGDDDSAPVSDSVLASAARAHSGGVMRLWGRYRQSDADGGRGDSGGGGDAGDSGSGGGVSSQSRVWQAPAVVHAAADRLVLLRSRQVENALEVVPPGAADGSGGGSAGLYALTFVVHGADDSFDR